MDPCSEDNTLFDLIDFVGNPVGDAEVLALVSSDSSAECFPSEIVELPWLNFTEVVDQVGVGVGQRVGKVNIVIVVFEGVSECEREVASLGVGLVLLFVFVLVVPQVLSASHPTAVFLKIPWRLDLWVGMQEFCVLLSFYWVYEDLHAFVVEAFRFDHVQHVELYLLALFYIVHSEIEPLGVALRVYIVLKDQIVFALRNLVSQLKVSRLKSRFKYQGLIWRVLQNVIVLAGIWKGFLKLPCDFDFFWVVIFFNKLFTRF